MNDTFQSPAACYCRNPESFRDNATQLAKLHTNRPKVWFRNTLPWLPQSRFEELYFFGVNKWSQFANVEAVKALTEGSADWIITCLRIDGRGQVLADMMLPGPRPQHGRFDATEDSNEKQLWLTAGHEGGHGWGLLHFDPQPPPEWMEPRLNMGLDGPQAAEARLMASMYGEPKAKPVDPLPPSVADLVCNLEFRRTTAGEFIVKSSISEAGKAATLNGKKQMAVVPQPIYVAAHPAMEIQRPIEQPEDFDLPEKWQDDPTDLEPEELT